MKKPKLQALSSQLSRFVLKAAISICTFATLTHADGFIDSNRFSAPAGFRALRVENSASNTLTAMAIQPDGKIVVVGACRHEVVSQFCVARLTSAGEPDYDFVGPGGVAAAFMFPISADVGSLPSLNEAAERVALQADGKIVIGGTCRQGSEQRVCLARLNANGSFDTTFGESARPGRRIFSPRGNAATSFDNLSGLDVLGDGRIVFSGDCAATISGIRADCATVVSADGISVTNKAVFTKLGPGLLRSQVVDSFGRVTILGSCNTGGATGGDFCATRFIVSTMALDLDFDGNLPNTGNGRISRSVTDGTDVLAAAVTQTRAFPMGAERIIAAGSCLVGGKYEFCATNFLQETGATSTFATAGPDSVSSSMSNGDNFAMAVATDNDGRFVIVGYCFDGSRNYFCAARFHADGTPDASWYGFTIANNGKFLLPALMSDDRPAAAAYQSLANSHRSDGFLVIAGTCTSGSITFFCITRLSSYANSVTCDLDIDGDGTRSATVDGLILTRVMLGMTRNFMIGITPQAHARRKTHDAIRRYLVAYCGFNLP